MGVELEQRTGNLYDVVFNRKPELELWQQVFKVFPDLDRYPTRDLWEKHPSQEDLWRYAGRVDDPIILSNGSILEASSVETEVAKCPDVRVALLGGQERAGPFLIIEVVDDKLSPGTDKDMKLAKTWPYVECGNDICSDARLSTVQTVQFGPRTAPYGLVWPQTVRFLGNTKLYGLHC
jgi:hypothetical protein